MSGTFTDQEWVVGKVNFQRVDRYMFEQDAQGRVVKETVIPGDQMNARANSVYRSAQYAQIVYETVCGDYYVYTPAE